MWFPTPVGGTPLPADFAPCVLFAVLYGILSPLVIFRLLDRRSRTVLLIGTAIFAIERIVIYSLRATQAQNEHKRLSPGLLTYMQISFGLGYIGIANDMVKILRCLLVNTTFGINTYEQAPPASDAPLGAGDDEIPQKSYRKGLFQGWRRDRFVGQPSESDLDYPQRRTAFRRLADLGSLLFLAATVPGILAHQHFGNVLKDQKQANNIYKLRYASAGVALLFILLTGGSSIWAYVKLPRVRTKAVLMILTVCILMGTITTYRLSVMYDWTDSLLATGPNTLNSSGAKAAFYVLHALPEWLASLILFCTNVRQVFGTGPFGDWRRADETEEQRAKREEKRRKREEKAMEDKN
ncbi:hypothetical protein APHAL10511_000167 [Amanita phalloides]|nr:hypothetical protein APHAL10511_000167 [Amanita phalloides]